MHTSEPAASSLPLGLPLRLPSLLFQASCSPPSRRGAVTPLSLFSTFLVPESGLVCLASPVLAWKTCNRTLLPLTMVHYPTWWETRTLWRSLYMWSRSPMSLASNYLRSAQKFIFIPNEEDMLVKKLINIKKCVWSHIFVLFSCFIIGWPNLNRHLISDNGHFGIVYLYILFWHNSVKEKKTSVPLLFKNYSPLPH